MQHAPIKAYTTKELIHLYEVSYKTFKLWFIKNEQLKQLHSQRCGGKYTVAQVEIIFKILGTPYIN